MLQEYAAELKKITLLSLEEERDLWAREAEGDAEAHARLMYSYQPLVFKTAVSFHLAEEVTMELIQEGTVGILEAAENFDYTRGVAFSLFAIHRIRGRMYDFLRRESAVLSVSLDETRGDGWSIGDFLSNGQPATEEIAERHVVSDRVSQAVDRLPAKERQVLQGIFLENRSPAELAKEIHVTAGHIYRLEKQGVRRIRGMLFRFMRDLRN